MKEKLVDAIDFCRKQGIAVIYTAHVHRSGGCDMGRFADIYPAIANREALIDETPGAEIYAPFAPRDDELVIKKHRYSAFFETDLDLILRGMGIDTVVISGVTTENCCHATARDAMFRNYRVLFLSDGTATYDYPDEGVGGMSAADIHQAMLVVLKGSTTDVATIDEFMSRCP